MAVTATAETKARLSTCWENDLDWSLIPPKVKEVSYSQKLATYHKGAVIISYFLGIIIQYSCIRQEVGDLIMSAYWHEGFIQNCYR